MLVSLRKNFSRLTLSIIPLISSFFLVACGGGMEEDLQKNYVLGITGTPTTAVQELFASLVQRYNAEAGFEALRFTRNINEANSPVSLTPNLHLRDDKVGWGQWITETSTSGPTHIGGSGTKRVTFSMRIEFDQAYIDERMDQTNAQHQYDLMKLFAHEVGHGLQMDHTPDDAKFINQVMYKNIGGYKDFTTYFSHVRNFFGRD